MKPVRLVKKGRRHYGGIYRLSDGTEVYLARRRSHEVFRSGQKTISDAERAGIASWAIDEETLMNLRLEGVKFVGVHVIDTNDKFLTTYECFMKHSKVLNYERRGGALQRYLPLGYFRRFVGRARV